MLVSISLSGYTNNPLDNKKNRFVGKWETDNSYALKDLGKTITFYSEGTASLRNLEITNDILGITYVYTKQ